MSLQACRSLAQEKHHILYDDGEEEDLIMAKQRFKLCQPLPPLTDTPLDDKPLPDKSKDAAELAASPVPAVGTAHGNGDCDLPAGPTASDQTTSAQSLEAVKPSVLQDAAAQSRVVSQTSQGGHSPGRCVETKSVSAQHSKPDQLATDAEGAAPASGICMAVHKTNAEPDDAPVKPAAALQKGNTDAFDYLPSQAEGPASQQPWPVVSVQVDTSKGNAVGTGRGRKRLPVKRMAPAKRQRQLPAAKVKAAPKQAVCNSASAKLPDMAPGTVKLAADAHQQIAGNLKGSRSHSNDACKVDPDQESHVEQQAGHQLLPSANKPCQLVPAQEQQCGVQLLDSGQKQASLQISQQQDQLQQQQVIGYLPADCNAAQIQYQEPNTQSDFHQAVHVCCTFAAGISPSLTVLNAATQIAIDIGLVVHCETQLFSRTVCLIHIRP